MFYFLCTIFLLPVGRAFISYFDWIYFGCISLRVIHQIGIVIRLSFALARESIVFRVFSSSTNFFFGEYNRCIFGIDSPSFSPRLIHNFSWKDRSFSRIQANVNYAAFGLLNLFSSHFCLKGSTQSVFMTFRERM